MKHSRDKKYQVRVSYKEWLKIEYQSEVNELTSSEVFRRWIATLPDPPEGWQPNT